MPKFPPIPRLSIVIPIGQDLAAFEQTLVSVLENLPPSSEVIVAHDGSYDDPFELCDEVFFVTAPSNQLVEMLSISAGVARGRFVHVLGEGLLATPGWTEEAIESFEDAETGVVAPLILDRSSDRVVAAGWCDQPARLCDPFKSDRERLRSSSNAEGGAYLQASFWRRELLREMSDALTGRHDAVVASYACGQMIRAAGWSCPLATESVVHCDHGTLPWERSSFGRGRELRAIQAHFNVGGWGRSISYSLRSLICNVTKPSRIAESIGEAFAPLSGVGSSLHDQSVPRYDIDEVIMRMPSAIEASQRRAA